MYFDVTKTVTSLHGLLYYIYFQRQFSKITAMVDGNENNAVHNYFTNRYKNKKQAQVRISNT